MKALTLYQPYASAMALGLKCIETRAWSTRYRGPVVIHSAQQCTRKMISAFYDHLRRHPDDAAVFSAAGYRAFAELPFGQTLAVADLVDVRPVESVLVHGDADAQEERWGDYTPGRFAWIFANLRRLERPRHVSGAQGLWEYKHGALEVPATAA